MIVGHCCCGCSGIGSGGIAISIAKDTKHFRQSGIIFGSNGLCIRGG